MMPEDGFKHNNYISLSTAVARFTGNEKHRQLLRRRAAGAHIFRITDIQLS
jgi:hypothetical protein